MQRCLNVSAHKRTQQAHSACAVLQEQGSSLILVKTSEAEQRKAELSVPLATPHQQSVHCLLYVRARRFIPNKRSVSWTKTQYSAAHFVLANAARRSGQLDAAFSGGRVLLMKSEQLILTKLFHLLLDPRNPEIQLQDTLLCLPSESVKAALNEKPQSFHESSVCSDKPSDAGQWNSLSSLRSFHQTSHSGTDQTDATWSSMVNQKHTILGLSEH